MFRWRYFFSVSSKYFRLVHAYNKGEAKGKKATKELKTTKEGVHNIMALLPHKQ
jgi:hypothetical protein